MLKSSGHIRPQLRSQLNKLPGAQSNEARSNEAAPCACGSGLNLHLELQPTHARRFNWTRLRVVAGEVAPRNWARNCGAMSSSGRPDNQDDNERPECRLDWWREQGKQWRSHWTIIMHLMMIIARRPMYQIAALDCNPLPSRIRRARQVETR